MAAFLRSDEEYMRVFRPVKWELIEHPVCFGGAPGGGKGWVAKGIFGLFEFGVLGDDVVPML